MADVTEGWKPSCYNFYRFWGGGATLRSSQFFLKGALAATLVAAVSVSYAASDGTKGKFSSGTVDITLAVKDNIKVSGLKDIKVDRKQSGQKFQYGLTGVCVSSQTGVDYHINAASSNSWAGGFYHLKPQGVSAGPTNQIPYSLYYTVMTPTNSLNEADVITLTNSDSLSDKPGASLGGTGFSSLQDQGFNCNGTYNGTLWVKVDDNAIQGAQRDDYKDTVTVTVTPV